MFRDDLGELTQLRKMLDWYPRDVWIWMMACQWQLIQEKEALVARTGEVGDDLGSRIIAGRLIHDVIRLCFLQERQYSPYLKWLGSAFRKLRVAEELRPLLAKVLAADGATQREDGLSATYEVIARNHNALQITEAVDPVTGPFDLRDQGSRSAVPGAERE